MLSLIAKTQTQLISDRLEAYYKFDNSLQGESIHTNELKVLGGSIMIFTNDLTIQGKVCFQGMPQFKTYPNPPVGNCTLELESIEEADFMRISNMLGCPVLEKSIGEDEKLEVDVKSLEAGIYFITVLVKMVLKPFSY